MREIEFAAPVHAVGGIHLGEELDKTVTGKKRRSSASSGISFPRSCKPERDGRPVIRQTKKSDGWQSENVTRPHPVRVSCPVSTREKPSAKQKVTAFFSQRTSVIRLS